MVKIIDRDDRTLIFNENKVIGYVEDSRLYGFDADNYAVEICTIDNRNEIATRFTQWQTQR